MRKKAKGSGTTSVLGEASREGTDTPIKPTGSAPASIGTGGRSAFDKIETGSLVAYPKPTLIDSPFGQRYLTRKSRPVADDEIQAMMEWWRFHGNHYYAVATPTVFIEDYADTENLLADWYTLGRQMAKTELKYKHTPTSLADTSHFEDFLEIAFYAIANLTSLGNMLRLFQFNQAFSTNESFLPNKASRITRLWKRLSAIHLPVLVKMLGIQQGSIVWSPNYSPPVVRFWTELALSTQGGGVAYTAQTAILPKDIIQTEANLDNLIGNIEKAIWALECNIIGDADGLADFVAIRDLIDMLQDLGGASMYQQGLPRMDQLPGICEDVSLLNDLYYRGFIIEDSKGVGADQLNMFPVTSSSQMGNKIPIRGLGQPTPFDFTLIGAWKFGTLNDSTSGLLYAADSDKVMRYGCFRPYEASIGQRIISQYSREDNWSDLTYGGQDLADTHDTLLGYGGPVNRHAYRDAMWAAQVGAGYDTRWQNAIRSDYQIWMDQDDIAGNTAMMWSQALGVPYLR